MAAEPVAAGDRGHHAVNKIDDPPRTWCSLSGGLQRTQGSSAGEPVTAQGEASTTPQADMESAYAWMRLGGALLLATIGGVGMWSVVVALPAVQADFGVARADASLPYTLAMLGFGLGGIVMGRLSDRYGIAVPVAVGTVLLATGYLLAGLTASIWQFALVHGALIGVGSSATFAPLLADTSQWFTRRRGTAVAIVASGNYLAGALWPTIVQHFIASAGWRQTHVGIGLVCLVTMLPLAAALRRRPPPTEVAPSRGAASARPLLPLGLSPGTLQVLLIVAGVGCCVAMSMPQVHLVAYSGDLGHGTAHGARMLSLLLACGIVSRLSFGWISDRVGGLPTLLLGSTLQATALLLFVPFTGLASLYLVSALFGLFQGGIVPSYAIIVREYFPPGEAGTRVAVVIMATLFGMALGGWLSGAIFDLTGSYRAAFVHGFLWNVLNIAIAVYLLRRPGRRLARA